MFLNERRVTPESRIWGTARRDMLFSCSTSLFFTHVQQAYHVQNALLKLEYSDIAINQNTYGEALA